MRVVPLFFSGTTGQAKVESPGMRLIWLDLDLRRERSSSIRGRSGYPSRQNAGLAGVSGLSVAMQAKPKSKFVGQNLPSARQRC